MNIILCVLSSSSYSEDCGEKKWKKFGRDFGEKKETVEKEFCCWRILFFISVDYI